jgi:hypothetical protein
MALFPFMGALPSSPNYLPKTSTPNTVILEARISAYELLGDMNIQYITTS